MSCAKATSSIISSRPPVISSFLSNILDEENPTVSRLKEALRSTSELNPSKGKGYRGERRFELYTRTCIAEPSAFLFDRFVNDNAQRKYTVS